MKNMNKLSMLLLALLTLGSLALPACSKKKVADENAIPTAANADENLSGDSDSGKAMGLQTVHFALDSFLFDSEAKNVLATNAKILKDKPRVKVQIEGHCDARGGVQYNVALGEKRANSAKKFLIESGISADRITVISFGKEKPLAMGDTEEAYAKNRRDNLVITSK